MPATIVGPDEQIEGEPMLELVTAPRWADLTPAASAWLRQTLLDPFDIARIVVSEAGSGRMLGQDLARLDGINAGVSMPSFRALFGELARRAGIDEQWRAWHGQRLVVAAMQRLDEVAASHPLLAAHLIQPRPARRHVIAARAAQLFRRYAAYAPGLIELWLAGDDHGPDGAELPGRLSWQPTLLRLAAADLGVDPLELQRALRTAAAADPLPTAVFAVDEVSPAELEVIVALGGSREVPLWQIEGSRGEAWARQVATRTVALPGTPRSEPVVEVHNSHGRLRQVEVLRDELTRAFAEDSALEPRDVLIVCPHPERYAAQLDAVFGPTDEPLGHPGRGLRVQPQGFRGETNLALDLLHALIALPVSRASAPELTELLLSAPVARRWGFAERAESVIELVAEAGVRWGLDPSHRAGFDLGSLAQGTWLAGIDSLLSGLALAPGSPPVLPAPVARAVSSSDLELVGALAEALSRLRKFVASSRADATVSVWVDRLRTALTELGSLPPAQEWMLAQAHSVLADLAEAAEATPREVSRAEFARLLAAATPRPRRRSAAGNGSIQVVGVGELLHVDFSLVAMLGLEDAGAFADDADAIDQHFPSEPKLQLERLIAHARSASRVLIVQRAFSERSNAGLGKPVTVDRLLRALRCASAAQVDHAATASSRSAVESDRPGFGRLAHLAADARSARDRQIAADPRSALSPQARRRAAASAEPVGDWSERVTVAELAAFLENPAKAFLRSRAGITYFPSPALGEELPLALGGLDSWSLQQGLLRAAQLGHHPDDARLEARRRAGVPPGSLGAHAVDEALALVRDLWGQAASDWQAPLEDRPVDFDQGGGIVLEDSIPLRGGQVVSLGVSRGPKTLLAPWLSTLALAAQGSPAPAIVHRVGRDWGQSYPESRRLTPIRAEAARDLLRQVATAFRIGRQRLLAVPFEPAIAFVQETASREGLSLAAWQLPATEFNAKWRFRHESWDLFFGEQPSELFDDRAGPLDPLPPDGLSFREGSGGAADSRFAAWAAALYRPLVRGGEA